MEITQGARVLASVIGSSEASKFGQTRSICSHLSLDCLCIFDEGVSTEVEFPLVYYTLHGRGSGQGGGAAWPSHTEHRPQEIMQEERELFSLPLRMGGLNIALPQDLDKYLEQSIALSSPLASFNNDSFEIQKCELERAKISIRQKADKQRELISKKSGTENNLTEMKYTMTLASEKGASSWFNALLLSKHGVDLTKSELRDGIALSYTLEAKNTPAICPRGKEFSLTHALLFAKGR